MPQFDQIDISKKTDVFLIGTDAKYKGMQINCKKWANKTKNDYKTAVDMYFP